MFSFFTTNEANDALPDVIKKFEYSLAKNTEVKKIEQELQICILHLLTRELNLKLCVLSK